MREPRRYRDEHDLAAMHSLLVAGRQADNGTYYIHTGDLSWWLHYPPWEGALWEHILLWDDPEQPGRLLGWALITPGWVDFDIYFQPEYRGTPLATEMCLWAEQEAARVAREDGKKNIHIYWVRHDDEVLAQHFTGRGFHLKQGTVQLACRLDISIPQPELPQGFTLRNCAGLAEVAERAKAQYAAFESGVPFDRYRERFTNFMRSPVYDCERDIVAVSASGQVGAFCLVWHDPINQVGLFEPVGTHPDFQRIGLGRAVMLEGLRRLKKMGMQQAIVSTGEGNLPAIKLYENVGFQVINHLGIFEKEV